MNTTFIHSVVLVQRKFSRIEVIMDKIGNTFFELKDLEIVFCLYFKKLFTSKVVCDLPSLAPYNIKVFIPSDKDMRKVVFDRATIKVPRPDGFPAIFFIKNVGT